MAELSESVRAQMNSKEDHMKWLFAELMGDILRVVSDSKVINEVAEKWVDRLTRAEEKSITDNLTGAYNRAFVEETMNREIVRAAKSGTRTGLLFLDIDNFRSVNTDFGHAGGDRALKEAIKIMKEEAGELAVVGRWGGEELVIVLPECSQGLMVDTAVRIGKKFREGLGELAELPGRMVTVSIGASMHRHEETTDSWVARADDLMYKVKNNGKDRLGYDEGDTSNTIEFERKVQ